MKQSVRLVRIEAHDVGKLKHLHGRQPIALPTPHAAEFQLLVKSRELLVFVYPKVVFFQHQQKPTKPQQLVEIMPLRMPRQALRIVQQTAVDAPQMIAWQLLLLVLAFPLLFS